MIRRVPVVAALLAIGLLFAYPFWWLVSASLKDRSRVFDNALLPSPADFANYAEVWRAVPLLAWVGNSAAVGIAAAVAATVSSAVVAFGFARFRFRGRDALFGLVLATMMLPGAVTMVPVYLEWHAVGLATTQVPLWAGNLFGSAFYVFLLRQFFLGLPAEVFDAARVDGAGPWRQFRSIALPLARPGLVVVLVFELKAAWTDLIRPLIYLREPELYTLPRGLKAVLDRFGQGGEAQWELVMAASVVATVPMVLLFLVAQRYFVRGVVTQRAEE
ncbi:carbohydrate ABC transporter permease [Lentzea jiangxiensis]|uniref:Multiple sugar transport system permease protein n=1 Tax=Lentzea jiangxiensis TaxID=641025 RepID=A0A1H0LJV7_9PSEU|nr:carbohydrate ABC transporter permease [Lentzea jiangxiensis]SDO68200.1 multiple sugar transport system permease protein [Lentzea jiangxiensis]